MKKILSIGLGFLLVVSTIGITINKHYSGGELFSYALFGEADSCCEVNCECCEEESTTIKVEDDFVSTSFDLIKIIVSEVFQNAIDSIFAEASEPGLKKASPEIDKSPPPIRSGEKYTQAYLL